MNHTINSTRSHLESYPDLSRRSMAGSIVSEPVRKVGRVDVLLAPNRCAGYLGSIAALLVLANITVLTADYYSGSRSVLVHKLVKLFSLDLELNVPTFFSVLLLFTAFFLLGFITTITQKQKSPHVLEWAALCLGFLFMGFDEMASVHERLIEPVREMLGINTQGMLYYAWVVPAIGLVAFLGVSFLRFLINLPSRTRWTFMIAGAMYVGGAVGCEIFEGTLVEGSLTYNILVSIEESLEMGGVIVFIWGLLEYLVSLFSSGTFRIGFAAAHNPSYQNTPASELGLQS